METQKVILVTGASGNLGKAVVEKFSAENYTIIGTINKDAGVVGSNNTEAITVDLTNEAATAEIVEYVINKHKKIDIAVLTVGGFAMNKIADTKTSDIYRQYQLNFETTYNIAQPVFVQMLKQNGGKIFLIGSKPGLDMKNSKGMIAYGLSKSLLFRLAELMNDEGKGKNVVVNVIVPSIIDTPQNRKAMPGADFSKWQTPEVIAGLIYNYAENKLTAEDSFIVV